jgi:hypothetical protein
MSLFEGVANAVAELIAYVAGKATGRTLKIEPDRAQKIGEYMVIALVLSSVVIVTLVYS